MDTVVSMETGLHVKKICAPIIWFWFLVVRYCSSWCTSGICKHIFLFIMIAGSAQSRRVLSWSNLKVEEDHLCGSLHFSSYYPTNLAKFAWASNWYITCDRPLSMFVLVNLLPAKFLLQSLFLFHETLCYHLAALLHENLGAFGYCNKE
jgi:hypothetical protein